METIKSEEAGKICSSGSNSSTQQFSLQMEEADDLLSQYGIPLASNQVQYR